MNEQDEALLDRLSDEASDEQQEPSRAERIMAQAAQIEDGIYFGLEFDVYLQVPRLGGGDVQDLCVSPATFWRGSWLDPERAEPDEEEAKHLKIGRAYHCARLTPHLFERDFVREPCKADYAEQAKQFGACWNGKEIEAQLFALGQPKKQSGELVADQAERLEARGYQGVIWPLIEARFWADVEGRATQPTAIAAKTYDQIVRDMERIRGNGEVARKLAGEPEVSVFWTDKHGIQKKARFDNLDYEHWADLKTFDNSRGKRLEQAIADAVQFNRYHVVAAHYREASEAIRTGGLRVIDAFTDEQRELVARLQIKPEPQECWFIFQEKNGVPNLLARKFTFFAVPDVIESQWDVGASEEAKAKGHAATMRPTQIYQLAIAEIDYALRQFALYSEVYRLGQPWAPIEPIGTISDIDFSPYFLEGRR